MPRRGRVNSLQRQVGKREPKKRVVVVCEGSKTEPDYLVQLTRKARNALVELVIAEADETTPKQIVERACRLLKDSRREAKRTKDVNARADEVWCAFDVDEHPNLREAVQQAGDNGIKLAISNPNIELWFLLHFEDSFAHLHRDVARRRLKAQLGQYEKGSFNLEPFVNRFEEARERAIRLDQKHDGDGNRLPDNNPSSSMWRLVTTLQAEY